MPANIVKPGQEADWERAKKKAADEGQEGNYAYIVSIFQKMTKSLEKALTVPAAFRGYRIPGQVPGRSDVGALMRLVDMPKGTMAQLLDHTEPRLSPASVVNGLGFDMPTQSDWSGFLTRALNGAPNEVVVRKALYERFLEKATPPELRRAIFQRALSYYRGLRKSVVEVVSPSMLLQKADARGGNYYRRVKTEKGHRYYYDPDKYHAREDAHVDGAAMLHKRLYKRVCGLVEKAGREGCDSRMFKGLADRYGADKVNAALKAACAKGPIEHKAGYYRMKSYSLEKSQSFYITR